MHACFCAVLVVSARPRVPLPRLSREFTLKQTLRILLATTALSMSAAAQHGTAPNNYYPDNYNGSTFTGAVTETRDDQIVLNYTNGSKTESFAGRFETGCSVPRADQSNRRLMPSDIPKGTVITAFFNSITKKADSGKIKENLIIAIAFDLWQGQKIPEDKKKIYLCTESKHVQFRAFQ